MTAALKLRQIVENSEFVLAIELLAAAEALDFRAPLKSSKPIERARALVRDLCPRVREDRSLTPDLEKLAEAVRLDKFLEWSEVSDKNSGQ